MAGPEVGDIYLQTHADTKGLAAEIRRAAAKAGKQFGAEFSKNADTGLSGLGDRIAKHAKIDPNKGKLSGKEWAARVIQGVNEAVEKENLDFDLDLGKAVYTGNFSPMLKDIEDVNAQVERMRERITALGHGKGFTALGLSASDAQGALTEYVDELNRAAAEEENAKRAADDLAASNKKQADSEREKQAATKETARIIVETIKAQTRLAKANEKAAGKEQAAQLKANEASMRSWNKQILEGIKNSEKLARAGNLKNSTREANAYADAVADTNTQLRSMQTTLKKMGSGKEFKGQEAVIKRLSAQVANATKEFTNLQRASRDATIGMDRGGSDYAGTMTKNAAAVKAFAKSLEDIDAEIDVHANYPSAAEARAQGTLLGLAFRSAVDKATSKPSGGGGGGKGIFDGLKSEWNQFLYAFPAEVTILMRYVALIGTEISTLGSAVGSVLTAGISSLATAVGGLGAVAGATFPAIAYSVVLAAKSMKEFEKSFPGTNKAIKDLKSTFESVDVKGFAAEWSDSVRGFASTLRGVIADAQLGSAFGAAAAEITNTFTGVLKTPAFSGFITAMQTTIPGALANIGNGFAGLMAAALPFFTAAAPLARALSAEFSTWAGDLATTANSASGLQSISDFMSRASGSITAVVDLLGNLTVALGNVFAIGTTSGNQMLTMFANLAGQFRAFTESVSGQNAIAQWFATGQQVLSALIPLLGAVGKMFADIVTPATVQQLIGFINGLTTLMPVIGQIISALGQLNFLGLLVQVLNAIGAALAPVLPAIGQLAAILSGVLGQAITALQPGLNALGQALGQVATAVGPIVEQLGAALAPVLGALGSAFADLVAGALPVVVDILSALTPVFEAVAQAVAALAPGLVALFVAFNPVLRLFTLLLPVLQPIISLLAPIITFIADLATQFANVLNPILETVASMLTFSKALTPITGGLAKAGGGFENLAKSAGGFVEGIAKQLPKIATTIANVVAKVAEGLAKVLPQIANAMQRVLPVILAAVTQIIPAIVQALTTAIPVLLQAAIQLFTTLVTAITTVLPQVLQAILTALPTLIQAVVSMIPVLLQAAIQLFTTLIQAVLQVVPMLLQTLLTLLPQLITTILSMIPMLIQTGLQLFMSIVQALLQAIPQILTALLGLLPMLLNTLVSMIPQLITAGIQLFTSLVTAIANALPQIITALFGILPQLLNTIIRMIPQLITAGINLFVSLVTAIARALPQILRALFGILPDLLSTIIRMIPQLITTGVNLFISLVTAIAKALPQILSALFGILPDLVRTVLNMIPQLITAAIQLFVAIVQGISGAWPQIWSALQGLGSDIIDALSNIDLAQIGRDIMQSLWDGLKETWGKVTGWVSGIGSWIKDHKGPPSYDRVLLTPAGRQIMDGLQRGLLLGMPGLRRTLSSVTGAIEGTRFRTQVDVGGGAMARDVLAAAGANAGPRVLIADGAIRVTPVTADPGLTAQAVVDRIVLAMQ